MKEEIDFSVSSLNTDRFDKITKSDMSDWIPNKGGMTEIEYIREHFANLTDEQLVKDLIDCGWKMPKEPTWSCFHNLSYGAFCNWAPTDKKLSEYIGYEPPAISCLTGHHVTGVDLDMDVSMDMPIIVEGCSRLKIVVRKDGILIRRKYEHTY